MDSKQDYHNVHLDDHDGDRSSTEVESLIGRDEQWHTKVGLQRPTRQSKCSKAWRVLNGVRWGLDTVLLLAILGLVLRQQLKKEDVYTYEFGGDLTGVGPRFSQQITKFENDMSYAPMNTSEFFTDEVLQKWNKLMPKGMGFVWVNETHKYHDLPTPVDWPDKTVFTTSMTHSLHCLFAVVQTYSGLKANMPIPDDHHWHMIHCFAYMRQAIMCSADIALEGHETTFPDDNGGSDGWDSKHVCKDYSQVIGYLESVRAYDDQVIY